MNKQKIASLIKNSISLVSNFDPTIPLELQCQRHKLFENMKITDKDLDVSPTINKNAIGIRNLFQNPGLRLTVYYLEAGKVMKLHDHNQMYVVSKVLRGRLQAKSYKVLNKNQNIYEKRVNIYDSNQVFLIDGNKNFNLHQFKALESTFFLDIIFPDYNEDNQCHFYREKKAISEGQVILEKTGYDQIMFEDL